MSQSVCLAREMWTPYLYEAIWLFEKGSTREGVGESKRVHIDKTVNMVTKLNRCENDYGKSILAYMVFCH